MTMHVVIGVLNNLHFYFVLLFFFVNCFTILLSFLMFSTVYTIIHIVIQQRGII